MSPTAACTNITRTFGVASCSSVTTIGPSSSRRVRESMREAVVRPRTSASTRVFFPERHAGRRRPGHETLLLVGDVTLDEAQRFPALDDPPDRPELGGPH